MKLHSLLLLTIFLYLCLPLQAGATTIALGPSDCSAATVNGAISSASDGDTILLTCTGSVSWTTTVVIPSTKGIILAVRGGTNTPKSAANFPLTIVTDQSAAISVSLGLNNSLSRITGFKFKNTGTWDGAYIAVGGHGVGKTGLGSFRIDNNYLDNISADRVIFVGSNGGPLYGLIDNNTMHDAFRAANMNYGPYGILVWNYWKPDGVCWGKDGWTNPFQFGSPNFVFIEDNLFENLSTTPNRYMRHYVSHELGGRSVVRYNTFTVNVASPARNQTDLIEGHGFCICASNGMGTRGAEVYNNTFSGTQMGRLIAPRGGYWLIYDNTFNDLGSWISPIALLEYRAGNAAMNLQCSLTCPCTASWFPVVTDGSLYPLVQQIAGTYIWNNTYQGANQDPAVDARGVQGLYIQSGRDYFVSPTKPAALSSYTPYTYPHPLRNSDKRPSPPLDIKTQ